MPPVSVDRLCAEDIDEAFVLARLGYAELKPAEWRALAEQQIARPESSGGILLARDGCGRSCGLLLYAITLGVSGRPSLQVERLIAFDLMHPGQIADALIAEVLRLARLQHCDSLSLTRPIDAPEAAAALVLSSGVTVLHQVF